MLDRSAFIKILNTSQAGFLTEALGFYGNTTKDSHRCLNI